MAEYLDSHLKKWHTGCILLGKVKEQASIEEEPPVYLLDTWVNPNRIGFSHELLFLSLRSTIIVIFSLPVRLTNKCHIRESPFTPIPTNSRIQRVFFLSLSYTIRASKFKLCAYTFSHIRQSFESLAVHHTASTVRRNSHFVLNYRSSNFCTPLKLLFESNRWLDFLFCLDRIVRHIAYN